MGVAQEPRLARARRLAGGSAGSAQAVATSQSLLACWSSLTIEIKLERQENSMKNSSWRPLAGLCCSSGTRGQLWVAEQDACLSGLAARSIAPFSSGEAARAKDRMSGAAVGLGSWDGSVAQCKAQEGTGRVLAHRSAPSWQTARQQRPMRRMRQRQGRRHGRATPQKHQLMPTPAALHLNRLCETPCYRDTCRITARDHPRKLPTQ